MSLKEIPVDELLLGMHISTLDIPWIRVPFFRHRRLITSLNDIKLLKSAGVQNAVIDLEKSDLDKYATHTNSEHERTPEPIKSTTPDSQKSPPKDKPTSMSDELIIAEKITQEAHQTIDKAHKKIDLGEKIDIKSFDPVIEKTLESLGRNNKALLALLCKNKKNDQLISHHFRVLSLSTAIGIKIGYSDADLDDLAKAALLHNVGWVKLPIKLFAKRKPYTHTEKKLVQQNITIFKNTICQNNNLPDRVIKIIEQHQEKGDGSGYPKKLTINNICHAARILSICNHFDVLTHGLNEYPGALPKNALGTLYKEAEKGVYDDKIVSNLVHLMGVYPLGSAVMLNTGEIAFVIDLNEQNPLQPIIKIGYNDKGLRLSKMPEVNLAKPKNGSPTRHIKKIIDLSTENIDSSGFLTWGGVENDAS